MVWSFKAVAGRLPDGGGGGDELGKCDSFTSSKNGQRNGVVGFLD